MRKGKELRELFPMLGKDRARYLFFVLMRALAFTAAEMAMMFSVGQVVWLVETGKWASVAKLLLLIGAACLLWVISCLFSKGYENCVNRMNDDIRRKVYRKLSVLPMSYFDRHPGGELVSRMTNDMGSFQPLFQEHIPGIVFYLVWGGVSIFTALWMNWKLCFLLMACSLFFKWLNTVLMKKIRNASGEVYEKNSVLVQKLLAVLTGAPVIKLFGLQKKLQEDYLTENRIYTTLAIRLEFWKAFQSAANALMTTSVADLTVIVGAWLVLWGKISLAQLLVLSQLSGQVTKIFWCGPIFGSAVSAAVAGKRVQALLEEAEEPEGFTTGDAGEKAAGGAGEKATGDAGEKMAADVGERAAGAVSFSHVRFSYGKKEILKDISFSVQKGQTLALAGESGSGKSTVLKLLLGLYDCSAGQIFIDGKPLSAYTRTQVRAMLSYVSQESFLFNDSVLENIRYGRPEATEEAVYRAAEMACADGFIRKLPEGYATVVGERAVKLSGGQRQRIAIARAILKDAPILLLDEATSAMDANSQEEVHKALEMLMEERTTLVVAHRVSTIRKADNVLVFRGGSICEQGTVSGLLAKKGEYDRLYGV